MARLVAGLSLHGGPERPSCEAVTGLSVRSNSGGGSARAEECLPGRTPYRESEQSKTEKLVAFIETRRVKSSNSFENQTVTEFGVFPARI